MNDPELGKLVVCYWRPPHKMYPRWPGGWYPVPPERREEFAVVRADRKNPRETYQTDAEWMAPARTAFTIGRIIGRLIPMPVLRWWERRKTWAKNLTSSSS